jgi:hypothetical protein
MGRDVFGAHDTLTPMSSAEAVKQVVPAAELRYFDGGHFVLDEFAEAIPDDHRDVLALGSARTRKFRAAKIMQRYRSSIIDPYHRPIDSSRWFWLNRICIRKKNQAIGRR